MQKRKGIFLLIIAALAIFWIWNNLSEWEIGVSIRVILLGSVPIAALTIIGLEMIFKKKI